LSNFIYNIYGLLHGNPILTPILFVPLDSLFHLIIKGLGRGHKHLFLSRFIADIQGNAALSAFGTTND
jgi:hypothetical protein